MVRRWGAASGIVGPLLLTIYFAAPAFANWPYSGGSPDDLMRYADSHQTLFYAGAWLQATGAASSVFFFLVLVWLSKARDSIAGLTTIVSSAVLLGVVLVEAALLVAVPMGAAAHDAATVSTAFTLSNGVFARVFPLVPAPALFAALGAVLLGGDVLPVPFARAAFAIAILFELAGVIAIFSGVGLIFAIVMSIGQELWIIAAAVALLASSRSV